MVIFHSYVSLPEGILPEGILLNAIASVTNVEETTLFFAYCMSLTRFTDIRHANASVRYVIKAGTLTLDICWDN